MNRAEFYKALRKRDSGVFGKSLSQAQVDTIEAMIDEADSRGVSSPRLAYIMATAYHEANMVPRRENMNYTTASRIAAVWPSRFSSVTARPYVRNPRGLANKVYNGRLGNRQGSQDGWDYRGGGLDQLTGRDNYRRMSPVVGVDLVSNPMAILSPSIAVQSLFHGMIMGSYRGHKLSEYINSEYVDFVRARNVVNADVSTNGKLIAGYARAFYDALRLAGRDNAVTPVIKVTTPKTPSFSWDFTWLTALLTALFRKG